MGTGLSPEQIYMARDEGYEFDEGWNAQTGYKRVGANYPTFTGGTYLRPDLLPPLQHGIWFL